MAVVVAAILLLTTALAGGASAHGSTYDPPSRNFGCWLRWGSDFQNPRMATEDPMCWQAWQADSTAMWNWSSLYREGVAGNHQAAIPDGQLCSAGRTMSPRYNSMDAVGPWRAANKSTNFAVTLVDHARHGADYIRVYVTKQGFNPLTQPLSWGDLELVSQIGNTPASQWQQRSDGAQISINASAPGRSGRHIVYTIWQASHADQSYYFCSDVNFTGSADPTPTTGPTTQPTPTTSPSTPNAGCSATYQVVSHWSGGFQAEIRVTAGTTAITAWTVNWTLAGGQQVSSAWGATVTTNGTTVSARNAAYNGSLDAGASTTLGFIGSGTSSTPALTCTAS